MNDKRRLALIVIAVSTVGWGISLLLFPGVVFDDIAGAEVTRSALYSRCGGSGRPVGSRNRTKVDRLGTAPAVDRVEGALAGEFIQQAGPVHGLVGRRMRIDVIECLVFPSRKVSGQPSPSVAKAAPQLDTAVAIAARTIVRLVWENLMSISPRRIAISPRTSAISPRISAISPRTSAISPRSNIAFALRSLRVATSPQPVGGIDCIMAWATVGGMFCVNHRNSSCRVGSSIVIVARFLRSGSR